MSRIAFKSADQSPPASLRLLDAIDKQLGVIPKLIKNLAKLCDDEMNRELGSHP